MTTYRCICPVNFKDGSQIPILDAVDMGSFYRVVFCWADSLDIPDQGLIPGIYKDMPKHVFQSVPKDENGVTLCCNQPMDVDVTEAEAMGYGT